MCIYIQVFCHDTLLDQRDSLMDIVRCLMFGRANIGIVVIKGWVRANALRLSRPSIDVEDTTTSTCWGSKCLWSQLLSFLLNWRAPSLVALGPGRHRELARLWRSCAVSWVAVWVYGPYLARCCACGTLNGSKMSIYNSTTPIGLTLVSGDSWRIALTLWC